MLEVKSMPMDAQPPLGMMKHDRTNISTEGTYFMAIVSHLTMNPFHKPLGVDGSVARMSAVEIHDTALRIVDLTMETCEKRGWSKQGDSLDVLYADQPRKAGF